MPYDSLKYYNDARVQSSNVQTLDPPLIRGNFNWLMSNKPPLPLAFLPKWKEKCAP
jgi:hypothetical protein